MVVDIAAKKIGADLAPAAATGPAPQPSTAKAPIPSRPDPVRPAPSKWRSFFGSLLSSGYAEARRSLLEFISRHFGFTGLIWLDRVEGQLIATDSVGDLAGRRVKLGIAADDQRLTESAHNEMPLELIHDLSYCSSWLSYDRS
jgi:hypothetical protein